MDFEELERATGDKEPSGGANEGGAQNGENQSTGLTSRLWFAWIMFYLVFPYGLYLFWKHKHKKSLYGVVIIFALIMILGENEKSSDTMSNSSVTNATSTETQNSESTTTQTSKSENLVRKTEKSKLLYENKIRSWAVQERLTHSKFRNFIEFLYTFGFEEDRISVRKSRTNYSGANKVVYFHKEDELPFDYEFGIVEFNDEGGIRKVDLEIFGPDDRYKTMYFWEENGNYESVGAANFNDVFFAKKSAFSFFEKKANKAEILKRISGAKIRMYDRGVCTIEPRTYSFDGIIDIRTDGNGQYFLKICRELDDNGEIVKHNGKGSKIIFDYLFPFILSYKTDIVGEEDKIFEDVWYIVTDPFGNVKGIAPKKPSSLFGPYNL